MTHKEFYEHGLLPGVHYVTVPTAADVPAMVEALKRNDSYAYAVAQAGRARMAALDIGAVTDFMADNGGARSWSSDVGRARWLAEGWAARVAHDRRTAGGTLCARLAHHAWHHGRIVPNGISYTLLPATQFRLPCA